MSSKANNKWDDVEDDSMSDDFSHISDEKLKKKMQNSVRWKRWWLKNREAYNEKRRLSAQLRSAKAKAARAANNNASSSERKNNKRARLDATSVSSRDITPTASPKSAVTSEHYYNGPSPSISPPLGLRPLPATLPMLNGQPIQSPLQHMQSLQNQMNATGLPIFPPFGNTWKHPPSVLPMIQAQFPFSNGFRGQPMMQGTQQPMFTQGMLPMQKMYASTL